jgi:hypothetical protein
LFFSLLVEATMPASDAAREVRLGIKKVHFMVKKQAFCVLNLLSLAREGDEPQRAPQARSGFAR